jgi:hypothetical protein
MARCKVGQSRGRVVVDVWRRNKKGWCASTYIRCGVIEPITPGMVNRIQKKLEATLRVFLAHEKFLREQGVRCKKCSYRKTDWPTRCGALYQECPRNKKGGIRK